MEHTEGTPNFTVVALIPLHSQDTLKIIDCLKRNVSDRRSNWQVKNLDKWLMPYMEYRSAEVNQCLTPANRLSEKKKRNLD